MSERITLGYGSGGELYHRLIEEVFLPAFDNEYLRTLADSAVCPIDRGSLAMTTDSFVVEPLFFPGGDIGRLAVCGTVNDLAMSGAKPLYLTVGMIIEAGFPKEDLMRLCHSMTAAAQEAGVLIVTGDTKVVEKGSCDKLFINTSGVGSLPHGPVLAPEKVKPGDRIIVSGTLGDHGMAVMASRHKLEFTPELRSDVAPLNSLVQAAIAESGAVKLMRDPTRGGAASTLNEWADSTGRQFMIREDALPVADNVRAACDLLGIDPLYCANEGKMLLVVEAAKAEDVLRRLQGHPLGRQSAIIGEVGDSAEPGVYIDTLIGSRRLVGVIDGEQLPRIC